MDAHRRTDAKPLLRQLHWLHVMNSVYAAADAKITALVGLDISAAFDTIDHDVLASHLDSQFGVVGAASSWLWSYLRGRQQGSVLGPLQCCCSLPTRQLLAS